MSPNKSRRTSRKLQAENWSFKGAVIGTFECKTFDPQPDYFKQLRKLVDFAAIKKAKLKVAVELMYGTGRGYLDTLLEDAGAKVTLFHDERDPLFGGHHPEPNAEGMAEVSKFVRSGKAQIGLGSRRRCRPLRHCGQRRHVADAQPGAGAGACII